MPARLNRMIREPAEIKSDEKGRVNIPLGPVTVAGLAYEGSVGAFSQDEGGLPRRAEAAKRRCGHERAKPLF